MTTGSTDTASTPTAAGSAALASPRRDSPVGLVVYALTLLVLVASGAAPSPLYPVYQEEWALPPVVLTVVFAVYVAGLLATLLTAGRLSDHIGRRPVILGALAVSIAAMLVFAFAEDGLALVVARILQGLAIGLATGALGAGMIDHQPVRRSGLAAFLNGVVPPAAAAARERRRRRRPRPASARRAPGTPSPPGRARRPRGSRCPARRP